MLCYVQGPTPVDDYGRKMDAAERGLPFPAMTLEEPRDGGYLLEFVRGSFAHTDCPEDLTSLLSQVRHISVAVWRRAVVLTAYTLLQRRRWMNGTFFALLYALQVPLCTAVATLEYQHVKSNLITMCV